MLNISYQEGYQKDPPIENAVFTLANDKMFILSTESVYDLTNIGRVIGKALKLVIKESVYGDEEMYIELDYETSKDMYKILQKLLRQIGSFTPNDN
jgi:predicted transcriptional regulator